MQMSSRCKESPIHHHHQQPHGDRGRITIIVRELAATEVHLKRGVTKGLITRPSHSHLSLWCMHHHVIVRSSRLRWSWAEVHFVWLSLCNFILRSLPFCLSPSSIPSKYSVYFINPRLEYFCVTLLTKTSTMGLFYQPQNGLVTRVLYVTAWNRNSYYSQLTAIWLLFPRFPLMSEPTDLFRDLLFYEWMKWQFGLGIGDAVRVWELALYMLYREERWEGGEEAAAGNTETCSECEETTFMLCQTHLCIYIYSVAEISSEVFMLSS